MGAVWGRIWDTVRAIPRGRVMTYGQISELLERRVSALAVGWAMSDAPEDVPWHRVVNARGGISTRPRGASPEGLQRHLLEREGIRFDDRGRLDLSRYRHLPRSATRTSRARSGASPP